MSIWMQYEASKLAAAEQQIRERGARYERAETKRAGLMRWLVSWVVGGLGCQPRPVARGSHAISAQELRGAPECYRQN